MTPALRATAWMSGAIVSFTAMAVAGRELSTTHDTFEIMFYRSLLGLVIVVAVASALGTLNDIRFNRLGLHGARNLAHFIGQNLWFFALTTGIPFAQVFALEFTAPLWAILLTPLLLGERLSRMTIIAGLIGFAGILVVARPGFTEINAGVIASATAAVFFALTAIATRKLTRNQPITCILFWLTAMQAVFGLICAGQDFDIAAPTGASLPFLVVVGLGGLCAHFCITQALSESSPALVMPLDFVRLPLIAIIGLMFYDEPFELWVFVGAGMIFVANYANVLDASRRQPAAVLQK